MIKKILSKEIPSLFDGEKIILPEWVKKIKIDVGTSVNAPNSEIWLSQEDDLMVFAFEPNPYNIKHIMSGEKIWPIHLDKRRINKSFFLINCALLDQEKESNEFFCTNGDGGTSSLFKPNKFSVKEIIQVPIITLDLFLSTIDWKNIKYIEQLKIDAQGSDFKILQGCKKHLQKIVFVTLETSTSGQYNIDDNNFNYDNFMKENNFSIFKIDGANSTYINNSLSDFKNQIKFDLAKE